MSITIEQIDKNLRSFERERNIEYIRLVFNIIFLIPMTFIYIILLPLCVIFACYEFISNGPEDHFESYRKPYPFMMENLYDIKQANIWVKKWKNEKVIITKIKKKGKNYGK